MKRYFKRIVYAVVAVMVTVACSSVAFTGRKRVLLYSDSQISSLSDQSYQEFMTKAKLSNNKQMITAVQEVGNKMTTALEKYLTSIGETHYLQGLKWNFQVVESEEVNAFCLPNGKIVFFEGIMKFTNTPDYIAVVMGHEIAHAVAQHGNERMSQQNLMSMAGSVLSSVAGRKSDATQAIFNIAFGLGGQYGVILPYSRKHEYEADRIGLIIMAMAGYDVDKAPIFWQAMSANSGPSIPEFLSTHPSDENRLKKLIEAIPDAKTYIGK